MKYLKRFADNNTYSTFINNDDFFERPLVVNLNSSYTPKYNHDRYLTFTNNHPKSTVTITLSLEGDKWTVQPVLYYSYDTVNWSPVMYGTAYHIREQGSYIKFKGTNATLSQGTSKYLYFTVTGDATVSGDITSLLNSNGGNVDLPRCCFCSLFTDCKGIVDASRLRLPSTTLGTYCYYRMFFNCLNLMHGPKVLPATYVPDYAYCAMFAECTALANMPELACTTIGSEACSSMFEGCSSLTYSNVNIQSYSGYVDPKAAEAYPSMNSMFAGCSSILHHTFFTLTSFSKVFYKNRSMQSLTITSSDPLYFDDAAGEAFDSSFDVLFVDDKLVKAYKAGLYGRWDKAAYNVQGLSERPQDWPR